MWILLLRIFASIAEYYSREQLISSGRNEEKLRVSEAEEEKRKLAKEVRQKVNTLPSTDVIVQLSKYKRD